LAGQETTSITLAFLVLFLLLDQRVQAKMQAELDALEAEECKGQNGCAEWVGLADRAKLPYVNAVINVRVSLVVTYNLVLFN
jgi:cytochrome P450